MDELQQVMKARLGVYDLLRCFFLQEPAEAFLRALKEEQILKNLAGYDPDLDDGIRLVSGAIASPDVGLLVPDLRVEFTRLFIGPSPVPLYESVYRSESGLVMQEETAAVRKKYLQAGLVVHPERSFPEDHIGAELEFIFYLCQRTAEATRAEEQESLLKMQEAFFREHLVHWIPLLCERLFTEAELPYYRGVAKMTRGFVAWDYAEIVSHFLD